VLISKPQNWSVPGCPSHGTQLGRVDAEIVGWLEQVDVALADVEVVELRLTEDDKLAEVVTVEKDDEVMVEFALELEDPLAVVEMEESVEVEETLPEAVLAGDKDVVRLDDSVLLVRVADLPI
jgi:hypothetical protein